jgi:hypothetical protein
MGRGLAIASGRIQAKIKQIEHRAEATIASLA